MMMCVVILRPPTSNNKQATTSKIQVVVVPLQVPDTVSEWGGREPRETTSSTVLESRMKRKREGE